MKSRFFVRMHYYTGESPSTLTQNSSPVRHLQFTIPLLITASMNQLLLFSLGMTILVHLYTSPYCCHLSLSNQILLSTINKCEDTHSVASNYHLPQISGSHLLKQQRLKYWQ